MSYTNMNVAKFKQIVKPNYNWYITLKTYTSDAYTRNVITSE